MCMRDDLDEFRRRELVGAFPTRDTMSARIPVVLKRKIEIAAMQCNTTPSMMLRFFAVQALKNYDIDGFSAV
ncbi:hypothetical protein SynA1560_02213 [Synechococcus sp. A15-60]|nr:hypothetical protein SynA1560_02213 [Synechococcus sp. A15-60]